MGYHTALDKRILTGRRLAEPRESSLDHHEIAFRDDHSRLILERRGGALNQIEQAFASGCDVSAV